MEYPMKDLIHRMTVKLVRLTSKNKVAFHSLAVVLIPICAAIQLCTDHLPELWNDVRDNFSTLEEQRQWLLANPNAK